MTLNFLKNIKSPARMFLHANPKVGDCVVYKTMNLHNTGGTLARHEIVEETADGFVINSAC